MKQMETSNFSSKLGKVRGLGSAKHGVMHWWLQRVTAIALIPLSIWFIGALISVMLSPDVLNIARWLSSSINAISLLLFLIALFYHAKLGLQVVIEDYIKCPFTKYSLLLANLFFCFGGATICIVAVLKLHFLNIAAL